MRKRSSPRSYLVPSIDRALKVIELLSVSKDGFTLSELCRQLKLPKSSAHLILSTLEERGYIQKNRETGIYRYGLKLISLSRTAFEGLELRDEARPSIESLMKKTSLTVHMAILERNEAVIIEKIEPPGLIKVATWIGRRMDVNCTGAGKALIAFLPEAEFNSQIKPKGLARHNQKTIVSIARLKRELAKVRKQGYAVDDEEDDIGLRCIGAPVFDSSGRAAAAISVSGTVAQLPLESIPKTAKLVKEAAAAISSRLGYVNEKHD
jgi:DNA-binding IclR family transcriptional regulator